MNWAIAGLVYAGSYVAVVLALGDRNDARLIVGSIGLLLPPLAPTITLVANRHRWQGRHAVFWAAVGAWPVLWLIGQIGWSFDEVVRRVPLPWFHWHIVLQLSASALPLIALVAWPHRGEQPETAVTAAVDIAVLVCLTGFIYWSLIVAPGMDPAHANAALRALATIGPSVRLAALAGLLLAMWRAGNSAWAMVYWRIAIGMVLAFVVLVGLSLSTLSGSYQTGSPTDVGWMLPFFFAAWAMATSPASEPAAEGPIPADAIRRSSPALLFVAILCVPLVGYGARLVVPATPAIERMREIATAITLVCGVALVMVRLRIERRSADRADRRVRLLATACEQAGDLMLIVRRGRIVYVNHAFCAATGYSREDVATLPVAALAAPETTPDFPAIRQRLLNREIVRTTATIARKDGTSFDAALSAAPIVVAAGTVTDFVAVIRDVTDDIRLREQLVRGERMSAIGELVSGVTHEINNPLQSVIGTVELLLGESHEPRIREDLQRARIEAGRAGRIVRNLLAFVRRSPEERLLTDLNEIVQATVSVRAYEMRQVNIEIIEHYGPNLPVVLASRDEIQQVILNLVMNAEHAMIAARGRGTLTVRTYTLADQAVVEIADDGPGVPPDAAGRIFEPFFTTKSRGGGSGLGLSLAFGIVKSHGGTLELVPTARGACFRVALPGSGFPGPVQVH